MHSSKIVIVPGAFTFNGSRFVDQTSGHLATVNVETYHVQDDGKMVPHIQAPARPGPEFVAIDPLMDYKKFYYGPRGGLMITNLLIADEYIVEKVWDHSEFLDFLEGLPFTKHVLVQRQYNSWSFNFGSFQERELMRVSFDQLRKKTTFEFRTPETHTAERRSETVDSVKHWLLTNVPEHEVAPSGYNQFKVSIRDDELAVMFKLTWAHLIATT